MVTGSLALSPQQVDKSTCLDRHHPCIYCSVRHHRCIYLLGSTPQVHLSARTDNIGVVIAWIKTIGAFICLVRHHRSIYLFGPTPHGRECWNRGESTSVENGRANLGQLHVTIREPRRSNIPYIYSQLGPLPVDGYRLCLSPTGG